MLHIRGQRNQVFNVGLDEKLDYKGYTSTTTRPKSREAIKKLMKQHGVCDVFRDRHPTRVENTWQQKDVRQARNVKQARLDYFLVDNELGSFVELVGAAEPWNPAFDHRAVLLKVDLGRVQRGTGYWKMNNSLLDDPVYVDLVHNTIIKVILSYQSVEPGREILSRSQIEALTPEERSNIEMSLNPHQLLEYMMFRIQCVTRKYGAKKKKGLIEKIEQLEEELMELKKITDEAAKYDAVTGHDFSPEKEEEIIEALEKANEKRREKEQLNSHINQGAYIRTGQHWKCESEAGSKLFFQQEKWRGEQRYIGILEVDSGKKDGSTKLIESQPEIEEEIHRFYKDLYTKRATKSTKEDMKSFMGEGYDSFENILGRKLPGTVQEKLEKPISQEEVMQALLKGKHGKAPGITGFTREFYQTFAAVLIGPIMKYIKFTEEEGQISDQHRMGIITLLPKGTKSKRDLRNWRPITLLTTLYKIISGTIAERVKTVLPHIIGEDQKGFVDGRYMGEVTRTLYDIIHDAWSNDKKGVLLSIDFEKAFDSLSHDFIELVMEVAGFGSMLKKWVKILLKKFSSRVNHVGNLITAIDLGRGARQGDPIASLLFVLCIEVLLITIRTNPKIESYKFFKGLEGEDISSEAEAFADDVTLTLPYQESSLREAVATFHRFSELSGLSLNQGKTQVMIIGKQYNTAAILAPDLELNWVKEITILGIKLYPNPEMMESNFASKVDDIKNLLNRWTFRNLTVFGRIQIVKSLGLSKLTHVVQVVPNPPRQVIQDLQKAINHFVWEGGSQKKHVINEARSQQPLARGGLAVPNVEQFWEGLKCTWIHRLFQSSETSKWRRLALRDLRGALRKPTLDCTNLVTESPESIASASSKISNPFWAPIWKKLPILNNSFNDKHDEAHLLEERLVWGTSCFLTEAGETLNTNDFEPEVVKAFKTVGDCIMEGPERDKKVLALSNRGLAQLKEVISAIGEYMLKIRKTFNCITRNSHGPHHLGWSRLMSEIHRSRAAFQLIQDNKHRSETRNENEAKWKLVPACHTMTPKRWDRVYKNISSMRCNLRIKYEEWRIAWGRQELNRDRAHYMGFASRNTSCSYCNGSVETEIHLYTQCSRIEYFWAETRKWTFLNWGVLPQIKLHCTRLFGMESERPDDLLNIYYRSVRYTIYRGREFRHLPNKEFFEGLMLNELKRKYSGNRLLKYQEYTTEKVAIQWYKKKLTNFPLTAVG